MRFTTMDVMPRLTRKPSERQMELLEFMNMGVQCVKITLAPGEYASTNSAHSTLSQCIKKLGIPVVVRTINGELYLIRTDME